MWEEGPEGLKHLRIFEALHDASQQPCLRTMGRQIPPEMPLTLHRPVLSLSAVLPCVPLVCLDGPLHRPPSQWPGSGLGELAEAAGTPFWRQTYSEHSGPSISPLPPSRSFSLLSTVFCSSFKVYSTWMQIIAISSSFKKRSHII